MTDHPTDEETDDDEIITLVKRLHETQQQLRELTGGEVDAVVFPGGKSYLLQEAQEKLRQSELIQHNLATTQSSLLDALPAHIALIDQKGIILSVNEGWKLFADKNTLEGSFSSVGQNYLKICEQAAGECAEYAHKTAKGIRGVLLGEIREFSLEYPCHSPDEKRWFRLNVAPIKKDGSDGAVVMHVDITERKLVEEASRMQAHILDQIGQAVIATDTRGQIFYANRFAGELYSWPILEMRGRNIAEVTLAKITEKQSEEIRMRLHQGKNWGGEFPVQSRDGRTFPVSVTNSPLFDDLSYMVGIISISTDISVRKLTEEFMQKGEREQRELAVLLDAERKRLLTAQNVAKIGSWEMNVSTLEMNWSAETYRIFETTPESFHPTHAGFLTFVHPEDRASIDKAFSRSHQSEEAFWIEHRLLMPDGRIKFVEERWQAFPGDGVKQGSVTGTCQDITERKKAEKGLRDSQRLLSIASRLSRMGAWSVELPGLKVTWSDEVCLIHEVLPGFSPSPEEAINYYAPEFRELMARCFEDCIQKGTSYDLELQIITPKRHRVWVRTIGEAERDGAGIICRVQGAFQDITERKEVETTLRESERMFRQTSEELAKVLDSSLDVICTFDAEGLFIQVSAACKRMWGYDPGELLGTHFLDKIHPEDLAKTRAIDAEIMAGNPTRSFENRFIRKDGSTVHILWSAWWSEKDQSNFCVAHDITETRRAEEEALELANRLTITLESFTDGFFIIDRDWRFTYLNSEAERLFRRSRQEVLNRFAWDVFPEAEGGEFHRQYERALSENIAVHFEAFYPTNRWFEAHAYPSAQGLAVYFRDVSEQRLARESLQISEERFRLLAKATNDAIWDWDLTTQNLWWNEGLKTLFGYSQNEVEPTIDSRNNRIHPEDKDRVFTKVHHAIETCEEIWSEEYRFLCKGGSYAYVLDRGHIIRNGSGKPVRMIGGMTDLTERKRSEARMRRLIESNIQGVYFWKTDGAITKANDSFLQMTGYTQKDLTRGLLRWNDMTPPESAKADLIATEQLKTKGICAPFEKEYIRKDGSRVAVLIGAATFEDNPEEGVCFVLDLTDRKKLEQQFLRSQRMESIGTLAGGIAHDLNNVLAPIILSINLLEMHVTDPSSQKLLTTISSSARRGADMVSQVLSFARGFEGRQMQVQIKHLLRDIEKIVDETFLKHIQVRKNIPNDLWTVVGDPTQLHQVLLNLCVNARDAMANGGTLSLSAENLVLDPHYASLNMEGNPGPYVLLQVEDSGTGMPPDIIEKIFDPFFTTKEIGKGTGLGLSTSLAIVKGHNGFIRVDSKPGKGTKFSVYLPAQTDSSVEIAKEISPRSIIQQGNGELILVVDDEESVRQITQQTLEAFGYRVLLASDGVEAVAAYASYGKETSVVLTDMMMPGMDGPATIQVLRKMNPMVKIICTSGLSVQGNITEITSLDVKHFLPKPYTGELLLNFLREVLHPVEMGPEPDRIE